MLYLLTTQNSVKPEISYLWHTHTTLQSTSQWRHHRVSGESLGNVANLSHCQLSVLRSIFLHDGILFTVG